MRKMTCIECGKEASAGVFCDECFLKKHELFRIKDFYLVMCNCGAWYDDEWKEPEEFEDVVRQAVEKRIKTENKIKRITLSMRKAGNFKLTITAVGFISPCKKEKTETKEANMFLRNKMCDRCVKFSGRYHEAVFQVRDDVDLIMKKLSKLLPKTCWKEEKKEGLNIYFLRKGDASRVARELDDIFTVKRSFKFVGMKKGKSLIRDFYSIRG